MQERQRRSFTEEYKRQAAELVVSSGRSITAVGKELGLRDSVLRRWVEKLRQEPAAAARRPTACFGNFRTAISVIRGQRFQYFRDRDSAKSRTVAGGWFSGAPFGQCSLSS